MYMHVHTCSMLFIHVNDSLCMCSNLIHAQQVAATRYHIYTHHNATFPFKSSLTENGEITWALGSDSSSTFGGGPSGAVSDQRVISDASTTCGFAPRGSIVFIGNHATTTADQHSAPPSHRFKRLDLDRETWKISTFAERALSFRACMWWTVWPSHDSERPLTVVRINWKGPSKRRFPSRRSSVIWRGLEVFVRSTPRLWTALLES